MSTTTVFPARLVVVEGNISAGKSTLSKEISDMLDYRLFLEPTISNPYLSRFYADPKRYALRMQMWLLKQRYYTYVSAWRHMMETGQGAILDRSVFSDWVFAEKNRLDGNITEAGFRYYSTIRTTMLEQLPLPDVVLYLSVSPTECYRRVHRLRQRDAESGIPLDYLSGLNDCYDELVDNLGNQNVNVLRIDWNNFGESSAVGQQVAASVMKARPASFDGDSLQRFLDDGDSIRAAARSPKKFEDDWTDDESDESSSYEDITELEKLDVIDAKRRALDCPVPGDMVKISKAPSGNVRIRIEPAHPTLVS
eukprot:TRINITY_DN2941_c0_g1_i1.p1 TRINITY_DN2941_c0_g1~~TRINITY_DN2941_c0_g1_i1.p1  ORF type:complete len:309 (+),score=51.91 TRINITY_DN2941_c0_g1_i1:224-1150(+)